VKTWIVVVVVLFLSLQGVKAQESTLVLQPGPESGVDAFINSKISSKNNFFHEEISSGVWTNGGIPVTVKGLVKFDLEGIKPGVKIIQATLHLSSIHGMGNGEHSNLTRRNDALLQKITSPWDQFTVTWDNQPKVTPINQAHLPASKASIQDYHIDVTAMVQDMVNDPSRNFGMMLSPKVDKPYAMLVFASSDYKVEAKRPKLEVRYNEAIQHYDFRKVYSFIHYNPMSKSLITTQNESLRFKVLSNSGKQVLEYDGSDSIHPVSLAGLDPDLYFVVGTNMENPFVFRVWLEE